MRLLQSKKESNTIAFIYKIFPSTFVAMKTPTPKQTFCFAVWEKIQLTPINRHMTKNLVALSSCRYSLNSLGIWWSTCCFLARQWETEGFRATSRYLWSNRTWGEEFLIIITWNRLGKLHEIKEKVFQKLWIAVQNFFIENLISALIYATVDL